MTDPRIQYVSSADGVKIAYWTLGSGGVPLLTQSPLAYSNISLEWADPDLRAFYQRLAADRCIFGYDIRAVGSSQRDIADCSAEANAADVEAVAARIDADQIDLLAIAGAGNWALRFAATHPGRIRKLITCAVPAEDATPEQNKTLETFLTLAENDWRTASEAFMHSVMGWSRGQEAHEGAGYLRASVTSEDFVRQWRAVITTKYFSAILPMLPEITAQTLVIDQVRPLQGRHHASLLAAGIPNAQLLRVPSDAHVAHKNPAIVEAILRFLTDGSPQEAVDVAAGSTTGMTAILFADIVDSTALTERLGDAAFRSKARDLDAALRTVIRDHAGTPVEGKLLGDGVLAVFTSARQAIEAALACGTAGGHAGLPLHLGLHAGDVIRESDPDGRDNVYGGAVNIASRISGLSAPGEVLVSDTVRSLARTSAGVSFEDRGERSFKGVGDAVRVWAVCGDE